MDSMTPDVNMDGITLLSPAELNVLAMERFIYKRVDEDMVKYLAEAAAGVIQCDSDMMPPPTQVSRRGYPTRAVRSTNTPLPSLEQFIWQLVDSSNVQVPTLMSTLVYLRRLKSRLQPMAKGLRCTTHRIFLASLILAAKYLNDSSPKNKHWAHYSVVSTKDYIFGFSRTEVNLMEKQLLHLLDWDLRITEEDLCREFERFLAPLRIEIQDEHIEMQKEQRRRRQKREQEMRERKLEEERLARQREREMEADLWRPLAQSQAAWVASREHTAYVTPPSSRGTSRSRQATYTPSHSRGSSRDVSPPGLESSGSSYAGSTTSRATTPLSEADITTAHQPSIFDGHEYGAGGVYDSPMDVQEVFDERPPSVPEKDVVYLQQQQSRGRMHHHHHHHHHHQPQVAAKQPQMLPFEITADQLRDLEQSGRNASAKKFKEIFGRVFGTAR
ncbi:hypothetical protein MYCTH_2306242 [Thermothelomyces thermophilus ATCC 42464]|uniref:Cyclin-like domain-containing protein n=1 Tax=Thermothelomyces thermophilus (strain ATCC 42464 / BCRC 31852 / DSM 1799) TaxID=573729 RepID=G2QH68_THET4|nr:uncharacterized protein MYCTH_2306242 [Thermothelomyces thermophilus ATCC 42464]AEO58728.1 hypothetical protein MYCTH_2306242 [Thermothelomyces thermophilus ATCC 42464]